MVTLLGCNKVMGRKSQVNLILSHVYPMLFDTANYRDEKAVIQNEKYK
jgi:hypothetical protein